MVRIRKELLSLREFHTADQPAVACTQDQRELVRAFNARVLGGQMAFEDVACLCGATEFDRLASVDRYGMRQDTVMCVACGLVQSNPRMTKEECAAFYRSDLYRQCYEGADYLALYEKNYGEGHGRHIFEAINKAKRIGPGTRVLEIGAGGGWNLLSFLGSGAEVLGLDHSPSLTQLGKAHGINMCQGSLQDVAGRFDVIIMNHVFEHLLEPVSSLRGLAGHLRPGGIVYIAVPDICHFGIGQLQNAHAYYFSMATLEYYCGRAGFALLSKGRAEKIHIFGIFAPCGPAGAPGVRPRKVRLPLMITRVKTLLKRWLKRPI